MLEYQENAKIPRKCQKIQKMLENQENARKSIKCYKIYKMLENQANLENVQIQKKVEI